MFRQYHQSVYIERSQFRKACGDCWLVVSAFNYSWSVCMLTLHFGLWINNEKCLQFWDSKRDISLESAISMDESETITTQRCGHLVEPVPFDNFWEPYYLKLFHVMKVSIKIWWWKISFFKDWKQNFLNLYKYWYRYNSYCYKDLKKNRYILHCNYCLFSLDVVSFITNIPSFLKLTVDLKVQMTSINNCLCDPWLHFRKRSYNKVIFFVCLMEGYFMNRIYIKLLIIFISVPIFYNHLIDRNIE